MDKTDDLKIGTRRSYWNEAKARGIIEAWQQSGETLAAFARRLGVNRKRLQRWASRLGVREPKAIRFHPVQVRERASGLLAAAIEPLEHVVSLHASIPAELLDIRLTFATVDPGFRN